MLPGYTKLIWLILCCYLFVTFCPSVMYAAESMLPKTYQQQVSVTGWLMSEKLDGIRGYWDGKQMLSKNGNTLYPPKAFVKNLPPFPVEGEIWAGRGTFEQTVAIVKKQYAHNGWLELRFAIFDAPEVPGGFTERITKAKEWLSVHPSSFAFVIPQTRIVDQLHMQRELEKIERLGGEGLIIRKPYALYTAGRSAEILKVKNYQDAEAKVIAHLPGKGKNTGKLGSLLVETNEGRQFKIGSGFSDAERVSPPPIGSIITFKFYGEYQSGIPKFPCFLRIRNDHNL